MADLRLKVNGRMLDFEFMCEARLLKAEKDWIKYRIKHSDQYRIWVKKPADCGYGINIILTDSQRRKVQALFRESDKAGSYIWQA